MKTFSGRAPSQRADELRRFIDILREAGVRRYLEVGARHGDTFHAVMRSLPKGSLGVAVDLPGANWGQRGSRSALVRATASLNAAGYATTAVFGDSRSRETRAAVSVFAPFDAVLIDGDHLYDGVRADWETYGPMARLVAFHDIDGASIVNGKGLAVEVPRLWREVRAGRRHEEIVGPERGMGIGVVWQAAA